MLIVGAGLSGIGAAVHLQRHCPSKTFAILEARDDRRHLGPVPLPRRALRLRHVHAGLPLQALDRRQGDRRRPVDPGATCADTAREYGIDAQIRFGHRVTQRRVVDAPSACWTVQVECTRRHAQRVALHCSFLLICTRLLPLRPRLPARTSRRRALRRPRRAPAVLARGPGLRGKRVVVIGSGATAVTLRARRWRRRPRT